MARRTVSFVAGHYYHIHNRGVNREPIFRQLDNYIFLLRRMKESASKSSITIIAYCLMPNHYHLLVRQESESPVSEFIQAIFNSYTKAYNKAFNRTGTLFEGTYKAILVAEDPYLLHLCRYIHRNPLDAGLVDDPSEWPYSNYLEWVGSRSGSLIDLELVHAFFPEPEKYTRFVMEYTPPPKIAEAIRKLSLD
ncbi:MAG: hypothetical protein A2W35_16565 [Chloroflexi bacterium RBG_16_57_11]|nr:MAG: hypothetical protein A2W35_16565 [Chloroflexi bacterium RBG_16_57_11]